jgi:hypothetical protein
MVARLPSGFVLRPGHRFNGVKVFSATMQPARDQLGEVVSAWIAENRDYTLVEIAITQSSDAAFHCVAFSLFYWESVSPPAIATGASHALVRLR